MINSVFNNSVKRDSSHTLIPDRFIYTGSNHDSADFLLAPIHFLFNGRTVTVFQNYVIKDEALYPTKTWVKLTLLTAFIAPPVIAATFFSSTALIVASMPLMGIAQITAMGIALKAIKLCFAEERKVRKAISNFYQDEEKFKQRVPLAVSQRILDHKMAALKDTMTKAKIWQNPSFIREVDNYLKIAAIAMEQFFDDLEKLSNRNVQEMARYLSEDRINIKELEPLKNQSMIEDEKKREIELLRDKRNLPTEEKNPFVHHFFNNSFFEMYHLARRCMYFSKRNKITNITTESESLYFEKGTLQYRWREKFNELSNRFEKYIYTNTNEHKTQLSLRETLLDLSKSLFKPWENEERWNRYLDEKHLPTTQDETPSTSKGEVVLEEVEGNDTTEFNVKFYRERLKEAQKSVDESLKASQKEKISYCIWLWTTQDEKPLKGPSELFPSKPLIY